MIELSFVAEGIEYIVYSAFNFTKKIYWVFCGVFMICLVALSRTQLVVISQECPQLMLRETEFEADGDGICLEELLRRHICLLGKIADVLVVSLTLDGGVQRLHDILGALGWPEIVI